MADRRRFVFDAAGEIPSDVLFTFFLYSLNVTPENQDSYEKAWYDTQSQNFVFRFPISTNVLTIISSIRILFRRT